MTKNEAPILESSIIYHGELYGYNNIYIIDGSTEQDAITILKDSKWKYKIFKFFFSRCL